LRWIGLKASQSFKLEVTEEEFVTIVVVIRVAVKARRDVNAEDAEGVVLKRAYKPSRKQTDTNLDMRFPADPSVFKEKTRASRVGNEIWDCESHGMLSDIEPAS
jgi:hypothetical protein